MFDKKYNVSILDCKWTVMKRNLPMTAIPRRDEYIFFDELYYEVVNVIHMLDNKHSIFVVVTEMVNQLKPIENQGILK